MTPSKKFLRPCPVCEHDFGQVLRFQRFLLPESHPLRAGYDVVCCDRCGFVFADTAATQQDYDRFYASFSKYEDNKTGTGGGENPCDAARLAKTAEAIAAFATNRQARILDVGCANGGLLTALQKLGFSNLCGLDLPAGCVNATRRLGVRAEFGSVNSWPKDIGMFDIVILSHVMEHLRDVRAAVRNMATLLAPGGHLYLEVPDASEYATHVVAPFQDFNTEHINHFSPASMTNLMGQLGFATEQVQQKRFESSPGMPYPALFAFWRRGEGAASRFAVRKDEMLVKQIERYIALSQTMMDAMDSHLRAALARSPEVIVWGVGQLAMKLLVETCLGRARIVAFVDGNPINHGKKLKGVEILPPSGIVGLPQPIVITTTLHQAAIADRIRNEMRLANELIFLA